MVYTPVLDTILIFGQSEKAFRLSKINKPLLHAKFQTDWVKTVGNRIWESFKTYIR